MKRVQFADELPRSNNSYNRMQSPGFNFGDISSQILNHRGGSFVDQQRIMSPPNDQVLKSAPSIGRQE